MNTARKNLSGFGTTSASIAAGGTITAVTAVVESWAGATTRTFTDS